jgi:hypothetical protein
MSFLTKPVIILLIVALPHAAFAVSPCKSGLEAIDIVEGASNPPGYLTPDTESLKPTGKWPTNLIEQGWHNLRKAQRPLRILCRYKDKSVETIFLSESTNTCILRPGLAVSCE